MTLLNQRLLCAALTAVCATLIACGSGDDDAADSTPTPTRVATPQPTPVVITYDEVRESVETFHSEAAFDRSYSPEYTLRVLPQCDRQELPGTVELPDFAIAACWRVGEQLMDFYNRNADQLALDAAVAVYLLMLKTTDEMYYEGLFASVPNVGSLGAARAYAEVAWDENVLPAAPAFDPFPSPTS